MASKARMTTGEAEGGAPSGGVRAKGPQVMFQGAIGAQKRLASARLEVLRIGLWRGKLGMVWEADTDQGKRWVSYSERNGWRILKEPPAPPSEATQ